MPKNNTKQAMLPQGSEFIDNPIGTACGFALTIGNARFFFTPGVPVELKRMLEEQILPRLQKMRGYELITRVKRFHSFGIGESRADQLLLGIEDVVPDNRVKLGFQSHYPQLETKLTIAGNNQETLDDLLKPAESAVRERLGSFILCEDDELIEDRIVSHLINHKSDLAILETWTAGSLFLRLFNAADCPGRIRRGLAITDETELSQAFGSTWEYAFDEQFAVHCANALRVQAGCDFGFSVLVDRSGLSNDANSRARVIYALSSADDSVIRKATLPGREGWILKGAIEMGLDFLRRYFSGLDTQEVIDFEQQ